jgi:hypothetical protein
MRSYKSPTVRNSLWTAPRLSSSFFIVSTPMIAVYFE